MEQVEAAKGDSLLETSQIDWSKLVLNQAFMSAVDKIAVRRFGQGVVAEEAATLAIAYLSFDDWGRCKKFQNRCKPTTFLYTLVNNALEEFARRRFGRHRPPAWVQELGGIWLKLWQGLCLEKQSVEALLDRFGCQGIYKIDDLREAIACIKSRIPSCGGIDFEIVAVDDISLLSDSIQPEYSCETDPPSAISDEFQSSLLLFINEVIAPQEKTKPEKEASSKPSVDTSSDLQLVGKLERLKESFVLTTEELLLLKLVYAQGFSKSAASKAIGLPAYQAGRMINAVLGRIREALKVCDLDIEELLKLF